MGLSALAAATIMFLGCTKDAESSEIKAVGMTAAAASPSQSGVKAEPAASALAIEADTRASGAAQAVVEPSAAPSGQTDPVASNQVMGDKSYTLTVEVPDSVSKGAEGKVRVKVVPKKGWKMNKEFPTKLKVEAPDGVTVKSQKQSVKDAERFDDAGATFAVDFKADASGKKAFTADFKFAVCTEATCDPKRQKLAWVIDVK